MGRKIKYSKGQKVQAGEGYLNGRKSAIQMTNFEYFLSCFFTILSQFSCRKS